MTALSSRVIETIGYIVEESCIMLSILNCGYAVLKGRFIKFSHQYFIQFPVPLAAGLYTSISSKSKTLVSR
jgi:hypothetical protein